MGEYIGARRKVSITTILGFSAALYITRSSRTTLLGSSECISALLGTSSSDQHLLQQMHKLSHYYAPKNSFRSLELENQGFLNILIHVDSFRLLF